ncbi:hypothetical protein M0805_003795 [Coniferiporia weirii]|nr:hypothetical protein M0805_003795 [Coniferiporia weirii]
MQPMLPSASEQQQGLFAQAQAQGRVAPDTTLFNGLDASSSKQLAALSAAGNARRAQAQLQLQSVSASGGTSANYLGGIAPSQLPLRPDPSFPHALSAGPPFPSPLGMPPQPVPLAAHRPQQQPGQPLVPQKSRQLNFLQGLAKMMIMRNVPLPSSITGIDAPYDPASSPWKNIEPASELGGIKLAGRDVDLYKLWGIVFQAGGAGKVQAQNAWPNLLPTFGLPEQLPHPQENGNTSTAIALAQIYMMILGAFDDFYSRGMADAQRHSLTQQGRPSLSGPTPYHGPNVSSPVSSGGAAQAQPSVGSDPSAHSFPAVASDFDVDNEGRKRKLDEAEDPNGKRSQSGSPVASRGSSEVVPPAQMPSSSASVGRIKARRMIEYVPLCREIETAGGRDTNHIHSELLRLSRGHQLRDINEWGRVYVDALTMSIRSRISTELSYGLTTLILLSTMRSAAPDTGFLIGQCEELLDEVLDLLEELAFPDDVDDSSLVDDAEPPTNRQLVNCAHDEVSNPFASEGRKQFDHDPAATSPIQRRADLIRLILNILRNLSAVTDNQVFMAHHPLLVDLLLRITCLRTSQGEAPQAVSTAFSLPDLIVVRKDVLSTFVNLSGAVALSPPSSSSQPLVVFERRARRVFGLISSYLVDPAEAINPFACLMRSGIPLTGHTRAPLLHDTALEVFTRISQPDPNRKVISRAVPQPWLWRLFEALVHRLPTNDNDYKLVAREESWMSYLEKLILGLYSLAFLMPPELKARVRGDRSLSFAKVMLRFIKRVMGGGMAQAELRLQFSSCVRRSIETLKVIDDGMDSFDSAQPSMPTLSFGVGYGEVGDKNVEKGVGLLSGYRDDILWSVMVQRELDEVMFVELESLARIESEVPAY